MFKIMERLQYCPMGKNMNSGKIFFVLTVMLFLLGCTGSNPQQPENGLAGYWAYDQLDSSPAECSIYMFFGDGGKGFFANSGVKKEFGYTYSDGALQLTGGGIDGNISFPVSFDGNKAFIDNGSGSKLALRREEPKAVQVEEKGLLGRWISDDNTVMDFLDGGVVEARGGPVSQHFTYAIEGQSLVLSTGDIAGTLFVSALGPQEMQINVAADENDVSCGNFTVMKFVRSEKPDMEADFSVDGNMLKITPDRNYFTLSCTDNVVISKDVNGEWKDVAKLPGEGGYYPDGNYTDYSRGLCDVLTCQGGEKLYAGLTEPVSGGKALRCAHTQMRNGATV